MYPISAAYEQFLRKRSRTWILKVDIGGTEYGPSSVVSFDIENSLVSGDEFEIGTAIVSKLMLRMKTNDEIPPNARVVPYVGLSLADMTWLDAESTWADADFPWAGGDTEWLPLGEFFIDTREKANNVWVYTCYDKLMQANVPYISSLTYPTTMQAVWNEICASLGYTSDSSVVINPSYQVQVGPAGYTKRQMLGYIAGANGASVYVGKDGKIKFRRFSAAGAPVYEMSPSDYIRVLQTNPIKTFTRVVVTYDTDDGLAYEAGAGDENHTLYIENPFATQAVANNLLAALNGFSYMPIQMDARGYPQIEAGDRISFTRDESIKWIDANTAWQDMELPWDGLVGYETLVLHTVYSFKGGLKMTIEAPSKSEQQSEFAVDGSLSGAINRLNQNAVKQGKSYYGVTITKEEGFIVERSDHLSKAIFNSDDLSFWAEGERALWFDIPSRRFKFSGTLEGVDGDFSGTITASSIIGGTITGGAISGGTINGTAVTGGSITGSLIQTIAAGNYPRIELSSSSNLLKAESSASNNITMYSGLSGVPQLVFLNSGIGTMSMLQSGSTFNMVGVGSMSINVSSGSVSINAPGGVYANGIRLDVVTPPPSA